MPYGLHYHAQPNGWHMAAHLNGEEVGAVDITDDVLAQPVITSEYGIAGAGPVDNVASTGLLSFSLSNAATVNSGAVLGYYSPEHAAVREGFRIGRRVSLYYMLDGVAYHKGVGWLDSIDPRPGQYRERIVNCIAADYMNELALLQLNVETQIGKRFDEILTAIVAAADRQPVAMAFDAGDSTFPYALDSGLVERSAALTEVQRGTQSEYGLTYVRGDGTLTFKKRTHLVQAEVAGVFTDSMVQMSAPHQRSMILNKVRAMTHPKRVDDWTDPAMATVLAILQSIPEIANGQSIDLTLFYSDPTLRASRVGGTDMIQPVATTDYLANANEDGSGANLTAGFSVVATFGANSAQVRVTNNSGTDGFVTLLQVRGRGLYDYDPVEVVVMDQDSIDAYGERSFTLDMPYQDNGPTAEAIASFVLALWKDPAALAVEMTFGTNTAERLLLALSLDIGDAVTIVETVTGINHAYRIQQVRLRIEEAGRVTWCTWLMQRIRSERYFTLDDADFGQLDENQLGPL